MQNRRQLVVADLRGGINEFDPPTASGPQDTFMEGARNVEFFAGGLCRKRQGCAEPAGLTYLATSGKIASLFRHTVGTDEQSTELWYLTDGGGIGRAIISSLAFANVAAGDALTTSVAQHGMAASLNGKLFVAARSTQDRMHCWDGATYRRVGLARTATAPTTVNAAGTITDTRRYRVTWAKKSGAVYDLRSEPTAETGNVAMAGKKCTVSRPANPGESETHWELWGSSVATNYSTWYKLGEAAAATAAIEDDNSDITAPYGVAAQYRGENTLLPSAKYVVADENRLICAGSWETAAYASRVWFTAPLGATDIGDDERTPDSVSAHQTYRLDVARGVDGGITGLGGPLADAIYVFKTSSIWKLVKTGVTDNPYRVVNVHRNVGAINQKSIVLGEDENGQPAIYFLSRRGPYRIATAGLEYLGTDIEATFSTINMDADLMPAHSIYHHRKHQIWWWIATGTSNVPDTVLVYDVQRGRATDVGVRGGWTIHTGHLTDAYCSVMYSKELGGSTASYDLKPYFGRHDANDKIARADEDAVYSDHDGLGYLSWFRSRAYALGALDKTVRVNGIAVVARPARDESPCLWVRAERDWNQNWAEYHVSVPSSDKSRVVVSQPEPTALRQGPPASDLVSLYCYDTAERTIGWQLDALVLEYAIDGER